MQHAVDALGRRQQLRQPHHVALHHLEPRIVLDVPDGLARALEEAVEDRHLAGPFGQQQLGGGRPDQAGAADDQEAAAAQRNGCMR